MPATAGLQRDAPGATAMPVADQIAARRAQIGVRRSLARREEVATELFEAFSRGELERTLELLHPDIVFKPMTAEVTQAGEPYRGHAGIRRYMADVEALWQELVLAPTQIRVAGQAVVALGLVSGRGRAGAFENVPTTWVFKFEDELVVDIQIFSDARHVHEALVG